jgi:uncharacterized damage-inducible protein DinB
MLDILKAQYAMVQSARIALLNYCATVAPADFVCPLPGFADKSMRDLLLHVVNTYRSWLGRIAQGQPYPAQEPEAAPDVATLRALFQEIDGLVASFSAAIGEEEWQLTEDVAAAGRDRPLRLTPLELFMHVITHEFHHKGQVLTMSRQLGYQPADTDVIRF